MDKVSREEYQKFKDGKSIAIMLHKTHNASWVLDLVQSGQYDFKHVDSDYITFYQKEFPKRG